MNGTEYKKIITEEIQNIDEEVRLQFTQNTITIESIAIDIMHDEIKNSKYKLTSTENRTYSIHNNFLQITIPIPTTHTLLSIQNAIRNAIHETYLDIIEIARDEKIFEEPEDGILINIDTQN